MSSCETFCQAFTSCCSGSAIVWGIRILHLTMSQKCSIDERSGDLAGPGRVDGTKTLQRYASSMGPGIILLETGLQLMCHEG
ncbi:hypothetical protein TNCV_1196351 [Trichonephila clavipes]|uniref:Uncharacterized protein n=1 Tax=Trichonephila clavipes TaxID=2585209 RepID=A0A8X6S3D2_TRICX|nr:hypothetical protein TNCV_1196351 [Trichonephila clavipes]